MPLDFGRLDDVPEGVFGPVQGQAAKDGIQRAKESNTFFVFTVHFLLTVPEQGPGEGRPPLEDPAKIIHRVFRKRPDLDLLSY